MSTLPNAPEGMLLVELPAELAEFLLANCEANLTFGLQALPTLTSRDLQEQMVTQIENFKAVRAAIKKAREPL